MGISIAAILVIMVYRSGIERQMRRLRAYQRLRAWSERSKYPRKKD